MLDAGYGLQRAGKSAQSWKSVDRFPADAAIATGRSAVTFNAAGLNTLTVLDEGGLSFGGSVINYSVEGEILTELQSHTIAPEAFGQQYEIAPAPQDAGYSPIQLHYISSVLDALGL